MSPDDLAVAPPWLARARVILDHLAREDAADELDAGLMLRVLHCVEGESVPLPAIAADRERRLHAAWESGHRGARVTVSGLRVAVERSERGRPKRRPARFPREPAARLREDLGWVFPRLAAGCDVDQMHDHCEIE